MRAFFRRGFSRVASAMARDYRNSPAWEDAMLLAGVQASLQVRQVRSVQVLGDVEFRVFSQWGEDGIIEWLVSRLPGIPTSVVEFGVEDFFEANTRFLVQNRNWRALVMDGSRRNMDRLRNHRMYWRHDITAVTAFIDRDNINTLIGDNGFDGEIGILSIDLDGNDYWVWKAIEVVRPWIVVGEFNGVLGDMLPVTIPYDPEFSRMDAHYSGQYFGTSVAALCRLAAEKGYTLLGTPRTGINAFFVRNDVAGAFDGAILDRRPFPSTVRDARGTNGALTYTAGADRLLLVAHLSVVNVATGKIISLADAGPLYSSWWSSPGKVRILDNGMGSVSL